jgi:hypothetical protein
MTDAKERLAALSTAVRRLPRPLQILLVLLGVQVVARVWPDAPPAPIAEQPAPAPILGTWVGTEQDLAVHFGASIATVRLGAQIERVPYTVLGQDGDATRLGFAHEPPVERAVCVYGDRIDLACPSGVWAVRAAPGVRTGLPAASALLRGPFVHEARHGAFRWSIGVRFDDGAVARMWNGATTGVDACEVLDDTPESVLYRCSGEDGRRYTQRWQVGPEHIVELASGLRFRRAM